MSIFGPGIRPWKRQTESKRAADSSVPGKGELVVSDTGKVYAGDGATQAKNLSPMLRKTDADANYAPFWRAGEALTAGATRTLPIGRVGTLKANGTTGSSFDATEQAKWSYPRLTFVGTTAGTPTADIPGAVTGDIYQDSTGAEWTVS